MNNAALKSGSIACLLATSCLMNKLDERSTTIDLHRDVPGTPVSISVSRGPQWTHVMSGGPFKFNVLPQIVIWTQRADGTLLDTLYITGALGAPMTHAGKDKGGEGFWRQCFPAWSRRALDAGAWLPDKETPYTDAVTSATPHSSFVVQTTLPVSDENIFLYAEVNRSADHNQAFTEERTGWDGQPSVVYAVEIPRQIPVGEYVLKPVGRGDAAAADQVNADLSGLDSALLIVDEIRAVTQ